MVLSAILSMGVEFFGTKTGKREYGIPSLNKRVDRLIASELKSLKEGQELKPWMKLVLDGQPVYWPKPTYLLSIYATLLVAQILCSVPKLSWFELGVIFVIRFFMMDLYSGILHIVLDSEAFLRMKIPGFWRAAMEFQWHHEIPQDISSKPFAEVCGDLFEPMTTFFIFNYGILMPLGLYTHQLAFGICVSFLCSFWLQAGHKFAHTPKEERPGWVNVMQKLHLLLPVENHQIHHQYYDRNFCICSGLANPMLNWITKNIISIDHCLFWLGAWVFASTIEGFLTINAAGALLGFSEAAGAAVYPSSLVEAVNGSAGNLIRGIAAYLAFSS